MSRLIRKSRHSAMDKSDPGFEFKKKWKEMDSQFDEYNKLRKTRLLVAKGVFEKQKFSALHRSALKKSLSTENMKKIEKLGEKQKKVDRFKSKLSLLKSAAMKAGFKEKSVCEGYLYIRSDKNASVWRKRYVVLYRNRIEMFSRKGDKQIRDHIDLRLEGYVADSDLKKMVNPRKYGFMISDFGNCKYLAAESSEEKANWMFKVREVIRRLNNQESMKSLGHFISLSSKRH